MGFLRFLYRSHSGLHHRYVKRDAKLPQMVYLLLRFYNYDNFFADNVTAETSYSDFYFTLFPFTSYLLYVAVGAGPLAVITGVFLSRNIALLVLITSVSYLSAYECKVTLAHKSQSLIHLSIDNLQCFTRWPTIRFRRPFRALRSGSFRAHSRFGGTTAFTTTGVSSKSTTSASPFPFATTCSTPTCLPYLRQQCPPSTNCEMKCYSIHILASPHHSVTFIHLSLYLLVSSQWILVSRQT